MVDGKRNKSLKHKVNGSLTKNSSTEGLQKYDKDEISANEYNLTNVKITKCESRAKPQKHNADINIFRLLQLFLEAHHTIKVKGKSGILCQSLKKCMHSKVKISNFI